MKNINISNNVIRRLPRYLRKLDELYAHSIDRISSAEMGRQMGLTPSQIRQDLSCFGGFGQQGYGYNVEVLRSEIENILGLTRNYSVVVIGVGNLGHALIENFGFAGHGFKLSAAFDVSPALIGRVVSGITISDMTALPQHLETERADIAVLTTPSNVANEIANLLVQNGIRAIWNFTNIELDAEEAGIAVENIHFSDSLMTLSYYLTELEADEKAAQEKEAHSEN